MLSRVADSIFWMTRYIERAENLARFIDVTTNLTLDLPVGASDPWQPIACTSGDGEWFAERYGKASKENVIRFLTFDSDYPDSIRNCVKKARENARSVREAISSEMWEQINSFYLTVEEASKHSEAIIRSPFEFFRCVRTAGDLFKGITDATMSHNEGWHFAGLGRMLERADKTSRILDVKYYILLPNLEDVGTPLDDLQWSALLNSVSGFEMYRKRHHRIMPDRVVDFLVLDRDFPRAIRFCIQQANKSLHKISGSPIDSYCNIAEQRLGQLDTELSFVNVRDLINRGLHEFLDALQTKVNDIGDGIYQTYIDGGGEQILPTLSAVPKPKARSWEQPTRTSV
jgi:uncharacterized alpha-E superfamily protein